VKARIKKAVGTMDFSYMREKIDTIIDVERDDLGGCEFYRDSDGWYYRKEDLEWI
jgi:hypothetical protein